MERAKEEELGERVVCEDVKKEPIMRKHRWNERRLQTLQDTVNNVETVQVIFQE